MIPGLDSYAPGGKKIRNDIFDLITPRKPKESKIKLDRADTESVEKGNVSTFQTLFNLLKLFIGIGLLATPASFKNVGIVGGVVFMTIIGIIAVYTMML